MQRLHAVVEDKRLKIVNDTNKDTNKLQNYKKQLHMENDHMKIDIVFPNKNEQEFISVAKKLKYSSLCLIYDEKSINSVKRIKNNELNIYYGFVGDKCIKNPPKQTDLIIVNSNNRRFFVNEASYVYGIEEEDDYIHQRAGGLNDGLFKLMKEMKIGYMFTLNSIITSGDRQAVLGRIMQNIRLCQKYSVDILLVSGAKDPKEMKNPCDIESLAKLAGISDIKKMWHNLEIMAKNGKK